MSPTRKVGSHRGSRLLALTAALTAAAALAVPALTSATAQAGSVAQETARLAVDDVSVGNQVGVAVRVDVLANDDSSLVADSVRLVRPSDRDGAIDIGVDGEGSWYAVVSAGGGSTMIEFAPDPGFVGDPTPQEYSVLDADGVKYFATVTVAYGSVLPTTPTTPTGDLPATGRFTAMMIALAFGLVTAGLLLVQRSAGG